MSLEGSHVPQPTDMSCGRAAVLSPLQNDNALESHHFKCVQSKLSAKKMTSQQQINTVKLFGAKGVQGCDIDFDPPSHLAEEKLENQNVVHVCHLVAKKPTSQQHISTVKLFQAKGAQGCGIDFDNPSHLTEEKLENQNVVHECHLVAKKLTSQQQISTVKLF